MSLKPKSPGGCVGLWSGVHLVAGCNVAVDFRCKKTRRDSWVGSILYFCWISVPGITGPERLETNFVKKTKLLCCQ